MFLSSPIVIFNNFLQITCFLFAKRERERNRVWRNVSYSVPFGLSFTVKKITFVPFILKNLPILSKNTSLARGTTGSEDFKRLLEIYHFVQYRLWEFSCWSKPIWNPFHHIITNNDQHSCYRLSHDWSSKQYSCDKKKSLLP